MIVFHEETLQAQFDETLEDLIHLLALEVAVFSGAYYPPCASTQAACQLQEMTLAWKDCTTPQKLQFSTSGRLA